MLVAVRARRCSLSVPATPPKKLDKGRTLVADEIVIDLEDSVPSELKEEARAAVADALSSATWASATVSVRVNGTSTPWFENDMRAIAGAARLDSVVVPKVESASDMERAAALAPCGLQALIESALGLREIHSIAEATDQLEALIMGPADMSVSLGFPSPAEGPQWDPIRSAVVVAARAAGVQAIDGPFLQISDLVGLRASADRARSFGFDGKWALHPAQIEPVTQAFTPTAEEVAEAAEILDALSGASAGAALLDGEMVDEASRKRAQALIARRDASEAARE